MSEESTLLTPLGTIQILAESNAKVMLNKCELPCTMDNGMTVDNSIAYLLIVHPQNGFTHLEFSAKLNTSQHMGSSASGECLACIEWETNDCHLTIGTEDLDQINSRMPKIKISEKYYPIEYTSSSISIKMDNLTLTDALSLHFIISYKMLPDERECSAWYFADIYHEEVQSLIDSAYPNV